MKKLLLIILFTSQLSFSQAEKDDYKLYSIILSDILEFGKTSNTDSILLIDKYENQFKKSDYEIFDPKYDSVTKLDYSFVSIYKDTVFLKRLLKEPILKKIVVDLTSDFKNHPKIKTDLLNINNLFIQPISSEKFSSFFGKKGWRKNSWKRINRKYGIGQVVELSKIHYERNLASVYYGVRCGGLCGNGGFVIFEKINGQWKILTTINMWES
ncbi:hypothetical protein ACFQ0I_04975 [Mariniflexile aquimaris]|uniref:Uncharacterized protein n=1 Tax=Mariniflexile aquimaris TaxID=881009 RepID=A0ABW3BPU1_9FLAO